MLLGVKSPKINQYNRNYYNKYNNTSKPETGLTQVNPEKTKKIVKGLTGLGILGAAAVGYAIYKHNVNNEQIQNLKYIGQSIANQAVQNSNSRGTDAVEIYSKHIADKKAMVLKYKLENNMFLGKSKKAMEHIRNNLKQLELNAM